MSSLRSLLACTIILLSGTAAVGQLSPENLKKQVDARSENLSGFRELLDDPDPRRSLAAVEGMLASGDSNLERMALLFALTNPDATIRATALQHHFEKLPAIAVDFDATDVSEDELENLLEALKNLGGAIGPDKKGSFSFQAAPYNEDQKCYPAPSSRHCAMRIGAGVLSVFFVGSHVSGRWANLHADETGVLRGGVNLDYSNRPAGVISLTVRLLN